MMTDEKIVDSAIDLLNKSSLSGYRISKDTGFSEATIGLWRRGIKRPTLKNANQIIGYLNGISPDKANSKMGKGIPYFNSSAFFQFGIAKGLTLSLNSNAVKGYASLPGIEPSPDMFMVKAHGRSMLNHKLVDYSIPDGTWVVLKKVNSNTIQWGEVYGIATVDGFIIKKVMPSEQEGFIKCVSFNVEEDYLPFELPVVDVYDMAKLISVINMQIW